MKKTRLIILSAFALAAPPSPAAAARRAVSLLPSYTEIIFGIGAGPELVGVTNFCNWPPGARDKEKVGDYLKPNLEKIHSLKPDVVFAGAWRGLPLAASLRDAGVKVVELPEEASIDDIFRTINLIGRELGRKKEASALIKKMKQDLKAPPPASYRPLVYIEVDEGGWTAGGRSYISDAIERAGGRNVFSGEKKGYFQASWEAVVDRDPDAVVLLSGNRAAFLSRPMAHRLRAAAKKRVFTGLDRDAFSRPGPRIAEEIGKLRDWLNEK